MGYIRDRDTGKLVCDACCAVGARKRLCPFGYCYPPALCDECEKKHRWTSKKRHPNCEADSAAIRARLAGRMGAV